MPFWYLQISGLSHSSVRRNKPKAIFPEMCTAL